MIFLATTKRFTIFVYLCNMKRPDLSFLHTTGRLKKIIDRMKKRHIVLLVLLLLVTLWRTAPGWGNVYVCSIYPHIGRILTTFSNLFPFSIGDIFIAASIAGVIFFPPYKRFYRHATWGKALWPVAEYLVWLYVWFYAAWGLCYSQSDIYHRIRMLPPDVSENAFRAFAYRYADSINANYDAADSVSKEVVASCVLSAYGRLDHKVMGINRPFCTNPRVKTMVFSPLSSMAGVTGSMGPFFCEFTLNADILPHDYPFTYAHEFSHQLGISNEGEANFYAYLVCTTSGERAIRYSGYYHILPHIINNVYYLLGEKECERYLKHLRPEIRRQLRAEREYWLAKRCKVIDQVQDVIYEWYLQGNKVEGGRKSYSMVTGLIMAWEQKKEKNTKEKK